MKKILLISLSVFLLVGGGVAFSAEKVKQVISFNPVGLIFGIANVEYERNIDDASTWALRGLYWGHETGGWSWSAFGAGGRYRGYFYPKPKAPAGGFWGAGVDLLSMSADYTLWDVTESASAFFFGPTGEIGYKWLFGGGFALGISGEVGYYIGSLEILGSEIPASGFGVGASVNLGYAW
jgi:hypothetical protein